MKNVLSTPTKPARPLPPAPRPGGPAISVPIEQCAAWRKHHGLKIIGCNPGAWPPTLIVVREGAE